jgi:hypothetical protein
MDLSKWTVCRHLKSTDVVIVCPSREHAEQIIKETTVENKVSDSFVSTPLYEICDDSDITTKVFTVMSYAMSSKGKTLGNKTIVYGYRNYEVRDKPETNYYSVFGKGISTKCPMNEL